MLLLAAPGPHCKTFHFQITVKNWQQFRKGPQTSKGKVVHRNQIPAWRRRETGMELWKWTCYDSVQDWNWKIGSYLSVPVLYWIIACSLPQSDTNRWYWRIWRKIKISFITGQLSWQKKFTQFEGFYFYISLVFRQFGCFTQFIRVNEGVCNSVNRLSSKNSPPLLGSAHRVFVIGQMYSG